MKKNWIVNFIRENNTDLYRKIVKAFSSGKGLDFRSIPQADIIMLSPKDAFTYSGDEGDKYFKIWMDGKKIAFCTWANTLIDDNFRWKSKASDADERRDNSALLGNEPYVSNYLKSYSAKDKCSAVYMFPFESFRPITQKAPVEDINIPVCEKEEKEEGGFRKFIKQILKNL